MTHVTTFAFIGFHLIGLIDREKVLDLAETKSHVEDRTVITWLQDKYGLGFDMSLFSKDQLEQIGEVFYNMTVINERRKLGVQNNGLCLLAAYCYEAIQNKPDGF